MELHNQIVIDAPAARVWHVIGERFMHISEWAAPITTSCPVGEGKPGVGVTRACTIVPFGPVKAGVITERLTSFDRDAMSLAYEATSGMPRFVVHAANRWTVTPLEAARSRLHIDATVTLRGPLRLLGFFLGWQLRAGGARVAAELKHFVEHGGPHPRKRASAGALP